MILLESGICREAVIKGEVVKTKGEGKQKQGYLEIVDFLISADWMHTLIFHDPIGVYYCMYGICRGAVIKGEVVNTKGEGKQKWCYLEIIDFLISADWMRRLIVFDPVGVRYFAGFAGEQLLKWKLLTQRVRKKNRGYLEKVDFLISAGWMRTNNLS